MSNDDRGQLTNAIAWTSNSARRRRVQTDVGCLPRKSDMTASSSSISTSTNVPPAPDEEYMPPSLKLHLSRPLLLLALSHRGRVSGRTKANTGRSSRTSSSVPDPSSRAAVKDIVAPSDTPDQKLRKLYAAVMKLENTDYTREHTGAEDKAQGFKEVHNADDIWTRKRGSDDQLTELFVAMARAAGMKAYVGAVTNRDRNLFVKNYLSISQLDDTIAIVNVDGKDQFFDPGTRYLPLRSSRLEAHHDAGNSPDRRRQRLLRHPRRALHLLRVQRVANLTLSLRRSLSGTITMTYIGDPALRWRHRSPRRRLRQPRARAPHQCRATRPPRSRSQGHLHRQNSKTTSSLSSPTLRSKGPLGSSTGKRVLLPGDIFDANAKPTFPHEKREIAVYFD